MSAEELTAEERRNIETALKPLAAAESSLAEATALLHNIRSEVNRVEFELQQFDGTDEAQKYAARGYRNMVALLLAAEQNRGLTAAPAQAVEPLDGPDVCDGTDAEGFVGGDERCGVEPTTLESALRRLQSARDERGNSVLAAEANHLAKIEALARIAALEDEARRKDAYYQTQGERIVELEAEVDALSKGFNALHERELVTEARIAQAVAELEKAILIVGAPIHAIGRALEALR